MKALSKTLVLLLVGMLLTSCGGGGSGSNSVFQPTGSPSITLSAASSSIAQGSFTDITAILKFGDGNVVPDGTLVNATLTPATIGTISGGGSTSGATATQTTSAGRATFRFASTNQGGTAHITISTLTVFTATAAIDIAVSSTAGNNDPRLQLTAVRTQLPVDPFGYAFFTPWPGNFIGSQYIAEVDITWRRANGELVGGTKEVIAAISPVTFAGFSTLDDPTTNWDGLLKTPKDASGNEFLTVLGSGPVDVNSGHGTIFVHANDTAGVSTLTVTAVDPDNGQTVSASLQFRVTTGAVPLPANIIADPTNSFVYVLGSPGNVTTPIIARVLDSAGQFVPDPISGNNAFNNVRFDIVSPENTGGATLTSVNAQGINTSGVSVFGRTSQGIAQAGFRSGTRQGAVQVKITADRGDNNVDNGIQDPVSGSVTVVVSDGKLFELKLTNPDFNAILVNAVVSNPTLITQNGCAAPPCLLPPDPDGTYSLTVSALATDRQGNPVLPGTVIRFGSIDEPQGAFNATTGAGQFLIAGSDGDPQEGGRLFSAPTGAFATAAGGAGPGDSLLVFGKDVTGNRDLESAAQVTVVDSNTLLHTLTPFNLNNDTGASVNYGPVLPYIIGRAQNANITASAITNDKGVASTTLNYPVKVLGKLAAIWAQSNSTDPNTNDSPKLVTDAALLRLPGFGPSHLTANPTPIFGNTTQQVTVCLTDNNNSPIVGIPINFSFVFTAGGQGTADGIAGGGTLRNLTGPNGCIVTTVVTTNVAGSVGTAPSGTLNFSVGTATAHVDIVVNVATLIVIPSQVFIGPTGPGSGAAPLDTTVIIRLLDSLGNGVPNVAITGMCQAVGGTLAIVVPPGTTDIAGGTSSVVRATNFYSAGPPPVIGVGFCEFSAGALKGRVVFNGPSSCGFSPPGPGC